MNKQEAYEIAKQAELTMVFDIIKEEAEGGVYNTRTSIINREVISELNKLGFSCGLIDKEENVWHIDWSK